MKKWGYDIHADYEARRRIEKLEEEVEKLKKDSHPPIGQTEIWNEIQHIKRVICSIALQHPTSSLGSRSGLTEELVMQRLFSPGPFEEI